MMRLLLVVALAVIASGPVLAGEEPTPQEVFNSMDANGDKRITKEEFDAHPKEVSQTYLCAYGDFELADVNKDGVLEWQEFYEYDQPLPCE